MLDKLNELNEGVRADRGTVYGDPLENHRGIAQMWASILQPHWETIKRGDPVPPHVVALLLCLLKINRMRLRYHEDNYIDECIYLGFAYEWQKAEQARTEVNHVGQ
jgi:hypothetical protein